MVALLPNLASVGPIIGGTDPPLVLSPGLKCSPRNLIIIYTLKYLKKFASIAREAWPADARELQDDLIMALLGPATWATV